MDTMFESSIAEPGGASRRCPMCHQHVAIGVQCSLCHRWYHITPPPTSGAVTLTTPPSLSPAHGPTEFGGKSVNNMSFGANLGGHTPGLGQGPPSSGSRRRAGCVPVPFLMPFFCAHCCRTAAEVLLDSQVEQRPGGLEDLPLYGHDPDMDDESDDEDEDDFDAARRATGPAAIMRRNKELVERAVSEIAKAPEISRGSRVEVQIKWKNLFQPAVLRRTRAAFAARGLPLYGDPTAASAHGDGGAVGAGTMPEVEVLETDRYEQMADAIIDGHTSKQAPTSVSGHLSALERQSDMTLRQQRRHWIGQPLDYANVGRASLQKAAKTKRGAVSGASVAMPPAGSGVRLSHVAVRVDGSDDDEELIVVPSSAPPAKAAKTDGAATA